MGYRSFTCSRGMEWQAWDVIPALAERRRTERRSNRLAFQSDRRTAPDRRVHAGPRQVVGEALKDGWLCFEASNEKRRLTPIPDDWLRCAVARLEQYLTNAKPAARISSSVSLRGL